MSLKWKISGMMFSVTMRSGKWRSSSQQFIILENKALQRAEKLLRKWAEPVTLALEVALLGK